MRLCSGDEHHRPAPRPPADHAGGRGRAQVPEPQELGLLAYLILSEHAPARSQLASLLFAGADDPVRALRWGLAEIRRALGEGGSVDGDPVVLTLPPGSVVDVRVVATGTWADAVTLPGLGADLLEGTAVKGAAAFETWLLAR